MGKTIKTGPLFFFQGSEKVARQGVRRNQELLSKYFNSKLVPFLSKRHLTFGAFIQNTKIDFMLYYTFQSQRLEGQRTDPTYQSLTLVWFCLLWRAFSGVYNSFDKYFRKQLFENILFAKSSLPVWFTTAQKFRLNLFWIPSIASWKFVQFVCWHNTGVSEFKRNKTKGIDNKVQNEFLPCCSSHLAPRLFNGY